MLMMTVVTNMNIGAQISAPVSQHDTKTLGKNKNKLLTPRSRDADDFNLWLVSQLIDYGTVLAFCYQQVIYNLPTTPNATAFRQNAGYFALCLITNGLISVGIAYLREELHFMMLSRHRQLASRYKIRGGLSRIDWYYIFQTASVSQIALFLQGIFGILYYENRAGFWNWSKWLEIYLQFYAMLILRDLFYLAPFHSLMHSAPRWYRLHKEHHKVMKNAQSLHAFHINILDLVLENVGAPILLVLGQCIMSDWKQEHVGINIFAVVLLTGHDIALHSIDPYSAMYFCPVLDHFMKGNICHQLHHALNNDYIMFVPYGHLWSSRRRRKDVDRYNTVFETDFFMR
mmetsp:Transcript_33152/g.71633  ORF Transcript_33152/g.71633 Transcript_33152/m.71633 type:complete len:343 (+) Transcript_33152:1688-2716(+)